MTAGGRRNRRRLIFALLGATAFGVWALPGCGDRYADDLRYPARADWLVADVLTVVPANIDRPGRLPVDTLTMPAEEVQPDLLPLRDEVAKKILDPGALKPAERESMAKLLEEMFGTPSQPKVTGYDPADEEVKEAEVVRDLQLDRETLAAGSALYRRHCLHCHGLEGNGRGSTGAWVNPHPRDYRQGVYKYISAKQGPGTLKPRRSDLMHILKHGIEGTSMPSFGLLPNDDLEKMTSYVIHLSLRGEVEYQAIRDRLKGAEYPEDVKDHLRKWLKDLSLDWQFAQKDEAAIPVAAYPYELTPEATLASAARGFAAYNKICAACHKNYGRESLYNFDSWGTIVRPRDLMNGHLRGGDRPTDIYYRLWGGIAGANMVGVKDTLNDDLKDDEKGKADRLWDVVNFVRVIRSEGMRRELAERYKIDLDGDMK